MNELTGNLKGLHHDQMDGVHEKKDFMNTSRKAGKEKNQGNENSNNLLWKVAKWGLLLFGVRKLYRRLAV